MGELLALTPLFPGETDIDQLNRIYSISGTPDVWIHLWPDARHLPVCVLRVWGWVGG
jgi:hypothetical protein